MWQLFSSFPYHKKYIGHYCIVDHIAVVLFLCIESGMEACRGFLYGNDTDVHRKGVIKIIPDIVCISKAFLTAEICHLSQSMDTGVCPAGAVDIGRSAGEFPGNSFQLCLYGIAFASRCSGCRRIAGSAYNYSWFMSFFNVVESFHAASLFQLFYQNLFLRSRRRAVVNKILTTFLVDNRRKGY